MSEQNIAIENRLLKNDVKILMKRISDLKMYLQRSSRASLKNELNVNENKHTNIVAKYHNKTSRRQCLCLK